MAAARAETRPATQQLTYDVHIDAPPSAVWLALTEPERMARWMIDPPLRVEVITDWALGGSFLVRGDLHGPFENRGTVLAFQPDRLLRYTHLSSISRLPDRPESYTEFRFELSPAGGGTGLRVALSGFPTESILRHLDFYWRGTVGVLKAQVESGGKAG